MKYQVTFFDKENKYKPVATIIEASGRVEIVQGKWKIAAKQICIKRGWTFQEMTNLGYKMWKCRKFEEQEETGNWKQFPFFCQKMEIQFL